LHRDQTQKSRVKKEFRESHEKVVTQPKGGNSGKKAIPRPGSERKQEPGKKKTRTKSKKKTPLAGERMSEERDLRISFPAMSAKFQGESSTV